MGFVKRRDPPAPGSIPDVLQMFRAELRFYREIAPVVGVRVPECLHAEETDGTLLVLEDLSAWRAGADPVAAAELLATLHDRWEGRAAARWPWLRRVGAAADLVEELFDGSWRALAARPDLTPAVRALGQRLAGRVARVVRDQVRAGPPTLVHGDASAGNLRTGPGGVIAVLDWEDVGTGPGVADLAWLLLSSVEPAAWDGVIAAYGPGGGLLDVLPAAAVQAVLGLADAPPGSGAAAGWEARLGEAARRLSVS